MKDIYKGFLNPAYESSWLPPYHRALPPEHISPSLEGCSARFGRALRVNEIPLPSRLDLSQNRNGRGPQIHLNMQAYIYIYASKVKEHAQMIFTIYVCIYNYIHISLFASRRRLACVLVAGFRGFAIVAILPELGDFLPTLPPRENSL